MPRGSPRRSTRRSRRRNDDDDHEEEEEDKTNVSEEVEEETPVKHPQHHENDDDDDDDQEEEEEEDDDEDDELDEDTLRVLISTDNHLGYAERDPIRGLDSFAAFEEVLALAKRHKCDMVLFAGDLFHENKPSRRTLHKTMTIIRKYCMGSNPVQIQIVSNQEQNFKRSLHGRVNYEDEFYSVDLPIFAIHGNHDDPTRDGGTEMLAALDLLSISNFVNYFGRQDEVDKVEVSPILLRKGSTNVALYGMGSMRDERLNRMWQGKKVRFLRPENVNSPLDGTNDEDEANNGQENTWFNIFALHQNRDTGRGAKNCVHESMIPEWMDLVVWGHEHECRIVPDESLVGTFRITQPGSSVATSLVQGEAVRKHIGLLDIRGCQFRLKPIPLSMVRAFATGEVSLGRGNAMNAEDELDPDDPKVEENMMEYLSAHVSRLIDDAREQGKNLREDALVEANKALQRKRHRRNHNEDDEEMGEMGLGKPMFTIQKPDQVLVRLKVEHTGFSTLNNQRFGARFVSEVANPSDLLLFHRRRQLDAHDSATNKSKTNSSLLAEPLDPEELAELNVEDLIQDNLEMADKKLEILDEKRLGFALDEFVTKEQRQAFNDNVAETLVRQQKALILSGNRDYDEVENSDEEENGGGGGGGERRGKRGGGGKITTATAVREVCMKNAEKARARAAAEAEEEAEKQAVAASIKRKRNGGKHMDEEENSHDDDGSVEDVTDSYDDSSKRGGRGRRANASSTGNTARKAKASTNGRTRVEKRSTAMQEEESDSEVEITATTQTTKTSRSVTSATRPSRRAATSSRKKGTYNYGNDDDDSDAIISVDDGDDGEDDDDIEVIEEVKPKKRGRPAAASKRAAATPISKSQVSTSTSSRRRQPTSSLKSSSTARRAVGGARGKRSNVASSYYEDEDDSDDEDNANNAGSLKIAAGWGTANSQSTQPKRRRR